MKIISIIVLYCCLVGNVSHGFYIETLQQNMHDKTLDKKLGKQVFSFVERCSGLMIDQWCYTNTLSRILLVGEPKIFESVRWWSFISCTSIAGPMFDDRFNEFVQNVASYSQQELEESIKDAILLTPYSTKAYSISKLLNYLIEALQHKITNIKEQIEHDYQWDHGSYSSLKKSVIWFVGLMSVAIITSKFTTKHNENMIQKISNSDAFGALVTLGCLPASYKLLQSSYKVLTINPNADNQYLNKYEELLLFVQSIKLQLETNHCITFQLANGNIATLKDSQLTFNGEKL